MTGLMVKFLSQRRHLTLSSIAFHTITLNAHLSVNLHLLVNGWVVLRESQTGSDTYVTKKRTGVEAGPQ